MRVTCVSGSSGTKKCLILNLNKFKIIPGITSNLCIAPVGITLTLEKHL